MQKGLSVAILFLLSLTSNAQNEVPEYFTLLQVDRPNVYEILEAYETYYNTHEWVKNDYTRAYLSFVRNYPLSSFDNEGYPITPSASQTLHQRTSTFGPEWKAMPVKIDRTNCYYTGQNGVIRSIAVDPNNPNIAFAGGLKGGLWKTTDKGQTWSENVIKNLPLVGSINKIVVAPSNSNYVYVASNAGILKSIDGGNTFEMTAIDYRSSFPSIDYGGDDYRSEYMFVDVSRTDEDVLVASDINPSGLVSKVARSDDGGQTWSTVDFGYKNFTIDVKFHPTNTNIVYTLIIEGEVIKFYRSTDGGANFSQVTNGFANYSNPSNYEIRGRIVTTPAQPDLVAFYLNVNNEGAAFYKSTDAGASFSRSCCGTASPIVNKSSGDRDFFGENFSAVQIRWATTIAVSDVDANFFAAATNVQPRYSFDQMDTWYWTGEGVDVSNRPKNVLNWDNSCGTEMHGDIQDMVIQGNDIWVANDGGIALSEDRGITYKEVADGLPITMALGFDMVPGKRDVIVAAMDHNGVMVRDESIYGDYWKPLGGGDASGASINPVDDAWLYARPSGDNIIQRPDEGPSHGHPSYLSTSLEFGSGYKDRFNNMQYHPNQYYTLYAVDYSAYAIQKSTDNGASWTSLRSLMSGNSWSYAEVKVSNSNPDVLYVSDQSGNTNTLHRSNDGGATWTSVLPSNLSSNDDIRNIEIDAEDPDVAWLTVNGSTAKVYKTTNGGASWANYSTGLEDYEIFSMVHQHGSNGAVYVGTEYGVFFRDNSRTEWERYGTYLPGIGINFLKINYAKGLIRAGTERGIWENDLAVPSTPLAVITANTQTTTCNGLAVNFSAATSALLDDPTITYEWTFEGGAPETSDEENPSIFYPLPGSYDVSLTITDPNGTDTQTLTDFITVTGSCVSEVQVSLQDLTGMDGVTCHAAASPTVTVFNRGAPVLTSYTLNVYANDNDLLATEDVTTTLLSGESETVSFTDLDLSDAWRLRFVITNPNGTTDDATDNEIISYISTESISIPNITTVSYNSASGGDHPDNLFDGDDQTIWHNIWWGAEAVMPYEMVFDLNDTYMLNTLEMLHRQTNSNGFIKDMNIYTSTDGVNWGPAAPWSFAHSSSWQTAYFDGMSGIRFVKLSITSTQSGETVAAMAELKFKGCTDLLTFIDAGTPDSYRDRVHIYPNPTHENLHIEGLTAGMKVRIVNALGLRVYEGSAETINVSDYSDGTYFLQVFDEGEVVVRKWMKR